MNKEIEIWNASTLVGGVGVDVGIYLLVELGFGGMLDELVFGGILEELVSIVVVFKVLEVLRVGNGVGNDGTPTQPGPTHIVVNDISPSPCRLWIGLKESC